MRRRQKQRHAGVRRKVSLMRILLRLCRQANFEIPAMSDIDLPMPDHYLTSLHRCLVHLLAFLSPHRLLLLLAPSIRTMASPAPRASRLLLDVFHPTRPRPICQCLRIESACRKVSLSRRPLSTAPAQRSEMEVDTHASPRWSQTPAGMKAPVRSRLTASGGRHDVNKDPRKLDEMYIRFLGSGGEKMLSEETKWLAITHKSFDHGRRGFNDRLAFLGTDH